MTKNNQHKDTCGTLFHGSRGTALATGLRALSNGLGRRPIAASQALMMTMQMLVVTCALILGPSALINTSVNTSATPWAHSGSAWANEPLDPGPQELVDLDGRAAAGEDQPLSVIEVPMLEIDRPEGLGDIPLDLIGTFKTLDKVTARTGIIRLPINKPVSLGRLTLTMRSCRTAPPEDPPETSAFLEIDETRDGVSRRLFTGWMFASSPAINALEHPIHDVWPITCKTSSGDIYSGNE